MGPGCDTVTGGSLWIAHIKTLLLAQVCSDCLVNYNVGLFELYDWQIYISQGIKQSGLLQSLTNHNVSRQRSIDLNNGENQPGVYYLLEF